MNVNIRKHIINNFKNDNTVVLKKAIDQSIKENDEITLPGMGVFLELIWNEADDNLKNNLLELLQKKIKELNQ